MKYAIAVLFLFITTIACGAKKVSLLEADNRAAKSGVFALSAGWVKDKDHKFDIQINLKNESNSDIIVKASDIECYRGATQGHLRLFHIEDRTIDLSPNQMRSSEGVCELPSKQSGNFIINVKRVFSNPKHDGATLGDVIAKDIQLVVRQ